ncbi:putative bifunctional diguanylate cyclase/phosphodiesterase [Allokutzneria albata]|uniref:PAS domain S-box-containing protein/diguanylate cyclase (GGDEF) domain-containing protein n=1 Tax=Allokutzneria albata TaxID=211114 RepID=A0A1G9TAE4_ALLAB|nr:EAL domain-containing protein [Allokutzneria albata]SDM44620.1 PAS domain S-box-containing protein/diguanylate cyclase (GGDEF) domain-containing protein [Allokutzneria albata]
MSDDGAAQFAVLRHTDVGFAVTERSGRLLWVNAALAGMLGIPEDGAEGRSLPALMPGIPDGPRAGIAALLAPSARPQGHRWLEVSCTQLDDTDNLLYRAIDVTAWRSRELEATQQAQALHRAQMLGRMGNWEWYLPDDRVVWSDALLDLVGHPPGTELDYAAYLSLIHEDDRPEFQRVVERSLRTGDQFTYTHRISRADCGSELVFECFGEVVKDEAGRPVRMLGTAHDVTQSHRLHSELLRLSEEDPLTGLPNRRALTRELERQLAAGSSGALLLLDLDNFKDVNDLRGHAVGDRVMRTLATKLSGQLGPGQLLGRLGGDEFAVVLPDVDTAQAAALAEKLAAGISALPVITGAAATRMTASTGVAPFGDGAGWEDVLANADLALYASKAAGRNRVTVYEPGHYADTVKRVSVLDRLRFALDNDGFALHAMPMVHLRTGRILGYELLLRLEDGDGPAPGPAEFLPEAERSGLVLDIDRWVLDKALDTLVKHPDSDLRFNVNVSGRTLEDADFAKFVLDRLIAAGVTPGRLGLEITETAAMTNLDAVRDLAEQLRATGCRITLDDFGAGFGSFVHLKHLPITGLKIDGEFVRGIDRGTSDAVLVSGILEIARGLGLSTVAEWVERPSQVDALARLGVRVGQGFHLGQPTPLADMLRHRREHQVPTDAAHGLPSRRAGR